LWAQKLPANCEPRLRTPITATRMRSLGESAAREYEAAESAADAATAPVLLRKVRRDADMEDPPCAVL
jgi:hypothetical protein